MYALSPIISPLFLLRILLDLILPFRMKLLNRLIRILDALENPVCDLVKITESYEYMAVHFQVLHTIPILVAMLDRNIGGAP